MNSINRLVTCQNLYIEIIEELKTAHGSKWKDCHLIIQEFLKLEIKQFHRHLEVQSATEEFAPENEYASKFSNRLQVLMKDVSPLTTKVAIGTNLKVTSLLKEEIQRQYFQSVMPFSLF